MASSPSRKEKHKEITEAWAPRRELLYRRGDLILVLLAIDEYSPFDEVPGIVISDTPKTYSFAEVFYSGHKKFIHVERTSRYVK